MSLPRHLAVVQPEAPSGSSLTELEHELALVADDDDCDEDATLYNAVGIRVEPGRVIDCDAGDVIYRKGERVVFETQQGAAPAEVAVASRRVLAKGRLPRVVRSATDADAERPLRDREEALCRAASRVTEEIKMPAKIVRAEALSAGQRFALYIASEQKLPLHDLLRELGRASPERVEVRQVGMRDAAKVVGGVGPCGLQLCCNTFLSDFAPVAMRMAKDQGLAPNPRRVSGVCGKLLCCLVYEEAYYREQRRLVPRIGERVSTDLGEGRVREVDVLRMQVRVSLDSGEVLTLPAAQVRGVSTPSDSP